MRRSAIFIVGLLFLTPVAGGTLSSCLGCSEISCQDGFAVRFSSPIPVGTRITLTSPQAGDQEFECTTEACEAVFFPNYTPAQVTVTVHQENPTTVGFAPEYRPFRPNGGDCPPTCQIAEVEIDL